MSCLFFKYKKPVVCYRSRLSVSTAPHWSRPHSSQTSFQNAILLNVNLGYQYLRVWKQWGFVLNVLIKSVSHWGPLTALSLKMRCDHLRKVKSLSCLLLPFKLTSSIWLTGTMNRIKECYNRQTQNRFRIFIVIFSSEISSWFAFGFVKLNISSIMKFLHFFFYFPSFWESPFVAQAGLELVIFLHLLL